MEKFFMDTDVILDFLLKRPPYDRAALELFQLAENGQVMILTSAVSFTNIFYIARKLFGKERVLELLKVLSGLTTVLPADQQTVQEALHSAFSDFEDALQNACARQAGITTLVTRNIRDYTRSDLSVLTPDSYVKILKKKLS